jgi:transposase
LVELPWQEVRSGVEVKLLPDPEEIYVLARSVDRVAKERSMRRRQLKQLWKRLGELTQMDLSREQLLMKLGAAQNQSPSAWRLVQVTVDPEKGAFTYQLRKEKLRQVRLREGRYLLRTNLQEGDPAKLWQLYIQLVAIEQAFKEIKGDLGIRPVHHQLEGRIEAHIFVCFLAYCLHVTLGYRLKQLAPGLTVRSALEKFAAMVMVDVHIPTVESNSEDRRELILTRYTQPEAELRLLLDKLKLTLPVQPPPRITASSVQP